MLGDLRRLENGSQASLWQETLDSGHVWQRRFYDFVVRTEIKKIEKLKYIHRNPVRRGLVLKPEQWAWSSFRWYSLGEYGPVLVNEQRRAEMRLGGRAARPLISLASPTKWGAPSFAQFAKGGNHERLHKCVDHAAGT